MNAATLARIHALLAQIRSLEVRYGSSQPVDPELLGTLRAQAFSAMLDIQAALRSVDIAIETPVERPRLAA